MDREVVTKRKTWAKRSLWWGMEGMRKMRIWVGEQIFSNEPEETMDDCYLTPMRLVYFSQQTECPCPLLYISTHILLHLHVSRVSLLCPYMQHSPAVHSEPDHYGEPIKYLQSPPLTSS